MSVPEKSEGYYSQPSGQGLDFMVSHQSMPDSWQFYTVSPNLMDSNSFIRNKRQDRAIKARTKSNPNRP